VPLAWATTQNNLGAALQTLGSREAGTARLEQAVAAYRAALGERTRERVPLDWVHTTENVAVAWEAWGDKSDDPARWRVALGHAEAALKVHQQAGAEFDIGRATGLRDRLAAKLRDSS
jgi:hypothetical protein